MPKLGYSVIDKNKQMEKTDEEFVKNSKIFIDIECKMLFDQC